MISDKERLDWLNDHWDYAKESISIAFASGTIGLRSAIDDEIAVDRDCTSCKTERELEVLCDGHVCAGGRRTF